MLSWYYHEGGFLEGLTGGCWDSRDTSGMGGTVFLHLTRWDFCVG